jgi:protein gp37
MSKRNPGNFGSWEPGADRKRTSTAYWRRPLAWNAQAAKLGVRLKVFCASMADVFDNRAPEAWRDDLWPLIRSTPNLDWLLLTKRPQHVAKMLPRDWGEGWPHVWLGTTVENQTEAERRIPHLLAVPARVRFLSCEPLIGRVDLTRWLRPHDDGPCPVSDPDCLGDDGDCHDACTRPPTPLHWVIVGGESGPGARYMLDEWAASLLDQCRAAGVPAHMKQMGGTVKAAMRPIPPAMLVREWPA